MKFAQLLFTLALAGTAVSGQQPSDVAASFSSSKVVPDVISTFKPTALLNVVFNDKATGKPVPLTTGANLTTQQVALRPSFSLQSTDASLASQTFVLIMVDPDAPTPQNNSLAPIRHLVAPGLKIGDSTSLASAPGAALTNSTPALSDYLSPGPPTADPHRYTLLLFLQPQGFTVEAASTLVNASTPIISWDLEGFVASLGLGDPVAGNFWLTANTTAATTGTGTGTSSGKATGTGASAPTKTGNTGVSLDVGRIMASGCAAAVLLAVSMF